MASTDSELIEQARAAGFDYERRYHNCCQCTMAALQDAIGPRDDGVFQAGSGMGAGVGNRTDGVCGGYSGGVMHLSRMFGRTRDRYAEEQAMDLSNELAAELRERFVAEYGTVVCREIHRRLYGRTFDLDDETDVQAFEDAGAHVDGCTNVVGTAAAWTAEVALAELRRRGERPRPGLES